MATQTTNIGLIKPAGSDKIRIAEINGNMDLLDTKLGPVGNTSLQTQVNNKVSKSGDTMTGPLIFNSGNNYTGISLRGASNAPRIGLSNTGTRLTFDEYAFNSDGGERYVLPVPDVHDADVWQAILTTKPQASVYTRLCPGVDLTTNPSAQSSNDVIRFYDVNSRGFGCIGGTQYTNGQTNVTVSAYRTINNTTIYNGLTLGIQSDGTRVVAVSNVAPWQSTLGISHNPGDTYSEQATTLTGIIRGGARQFVLRVTLPKLLPNNATVTVTQLTGWFGGLNGVIGGSGDSTDWIEKSGVTVRTSIKSVNTVVIVVDTSTVLQNAINGPLSAFVSFTLSIQ